MRGPFPSALPSARRSAGARFGEHFRLAKAQPAEKQAPRGGLDIRRPSGPGVGLLLGLVGPWAGGAGPHSKKMAFMQLSGYPSRAGTVMTHFF